MKTGWRAHRDSANCYDSDVPERTVEIQVLRLHQEFVREKVLKVTDLKHLAALYEQHG